MSGIVPTAPVRGFRESEYRDRSSRLQKMMQQNGLDIVLMTTEPDFRYFAGFDTPFWQSPTRPWFLLIPVDQDPVAVIPGIGEQRFSATWVTDIRTWTSPQPDDEGITLLGATIEELSGPNCTIGLPLGPESVVRMPLNDLHRLQKNLSSAQWQDASDLIQATRQLKSDAEIDKIRYCAQAVSSAFAALPESVSGSKTVRDVFRRFTLACLDAGVDHVPYLVGGTGQAGYRDIIGPASDEAVVEGDLLILDTGCIFDGYYCDFDRNFAIGSADMQCHDAYKVAWQATECALELAQPGVTCSQLYHAMQSVMAAHAISERDDTGRLGHGLGLQLTETPSITADNHTVLQAGMVMTLEPAFEYAPGKFMVHEEDIVIRQNGAELLSVRASSSLPVIEL